MNLNRQKHLNYDRFVNSLKLFVFIGRMFNVVPIVLINPGALRLNKKELGQNGLQIVWSTVIIVSVIIATHYQHIQFDTNMGFLTRVLYMGEYFFGIVNMILILYGCHYQNRNYHNFIRKFIEIDVKFTKLNTTASYAFIWAYVKFYFIIYAIFFINVLIIDFLYNNCFVRDFFRSSTVYTIPNVISILALTHYSLVCYVIRVKYQQINALLRSLINQNLNKINFITIINLHKIHNVADFINTIRLLHQNLSGIMTELVESFGLLIITTLIGSFLILSIQLYAIYKTIEGYTTDDFYLTIYTILWIVLHGGKIIIVLFASDGVNQQRKMTGSLLYKIENFEKIDKEMRELIRTFSLQLLHESTTHHACGILELDLSLLSTIAGALTTYLVILIQFDSSTRPSATRSRQTTTTTTSAPTVISSTSSPLAMSSSQLFSLNE